LLIAMAQKDAKLFIKEMQARGHESASIIGRIVDKDSTKPGGEVIIVNSRLEHFVGDVQEITLLSNASGPAAARSEKRQSTPSPVVDVSCCASPPSFELSQEEGMNSMASIQEHTEVQSAKSKDVFAEFLKEVSKEGLLDKRTKKLMAIALSIAQHCKPCLITHVKSALAMGISKAEIDEAAYVAISFAGAPALMFYNEVCREIGI
jgi:AhpD family alkylhydroperoxidase